MYYAYNPDENQNKIIRHKCNNKKCCNPDHLISGSYRDNVLDIKREEMKLFEKKFFETNCDINILLQEFKISRSGIYSRIRKNGLREQYLEIKKIKELEFKKKRKKEKLLARIEKMRQREALKREKEKEQEEIEKIRNLPENIMKRNREKRKK
jgi:predicted  nucleic acid-binding Zn-ribbon protein